MKHHYVPQFLMRRWTNEAGRLYGFALRNGNLVCKARAPEYTGYESGLYAIAVNTLGIDADIIEKKIFSPIDSKAASVLGKFERQEAISEDDHIAWTFFLNSLRLRQPDVLRFLRTQAQHNFRQNLVMQDRFQPPPGPLGTEQWFDRFLPGYMEAIPLLHWLPRMIVHDEVTARFAGLSWSLREFDDRHAKLLLSDLPIHWEGGFHEEGFLIQLPVGPSRVFFGTRSEGTQQFINQLRVPELIERINLTTLASSSRRIWASNRQEAQAFITANLNVFGQNYGDVATIAPWASEADEGRR